MGFLLCHIWDTEAGDEHKRFLDVLRTGIKSVLNRVPGELFARADNVIKRFPVVLCIGIDNVM